MVNHIPSAATVIVVAGGDVPTAADLTDLPADAVVIGVDLGVAHAQQLGLSVTIAIGDFDSVPPDALDRAAASGAEIRRHPAAKDATDLELALDAAAELNPWQIIVLGAGGGRFDHQLANVLLLASPRYAGLHLCARMAGATLTVIHREQTLRGAVGDLVTLLPVHGDARGVTTEGLRYPLRGEDIAAGSSRGVSNVFVRDTAVLRLSSGVLVAVQPGS